MSRDEQNRDDRAQDQRDRGRLELVLDGGEVAAATGVGFFDHMLELLGRHGRSASESRRSGDLETGAHHTVEDVGIALGQALDEALGDRAGIRRYGYTAVPMDEALGMCAIDISGRPFCLFEAELPPVSIAGFDAELTEEFFRAVATNAKLTLHLGTRYGSNAHHLIEACFKAFARALREAVAIDPDETGVPSTKGTLRDGRMTRIAILDYGMGNLRSVEKALERVGAEAGDHRRPRASRARPTASSCPASARSRRRWSGSRELGLDRLIAERVDAGTPVLGICLGFQLLFESSTELGGADGPRPARGRGDASSTRPGSRSRTSAGSRCAGSARVGAHRGDRRRDPVLLRPQLRPATGRRDGRARHRRARRALRLRGRAPAALRGPVPPREVERRRPAAARATSPRICARVVPAVILYPAIDIRGGHAVRLVQGDYDRETVFDADPLDAARRWVEQGARGAARRRPRRRPRRRAR